jgi:hypothetical protein
LSESVLGRAGAILGALEDDTAIAGGPRSADRERDDSQLDLFSRPKLPTCSAADKGVLLQLQHVDLNRMTPLEALQLIGKLQRDLDQEPAARAPLPRATDPSVAAARTDRGGPDAVEP